MRKAEFYNQETDVGMARSRSGESDFGVWWRSSNQGFPVYRISVVHATGEVIAVRSDTDDYEVLGSVTHDGKLIHDPPYYRPECGDDCAYAAAERLFDGWADKCGSPGGLEWIKERLAT
jgi:hypothetical protein